MENTNYIFGKIDINYFIIKKLTIGIPIELKLGNCFYFFFF